MKKGIQSRREQLRQMRERDKLQTTGQNKDKRIIQSILEDLKQQKIIPIIGDTIHNNRIFHLHGSSDDEKQESPALPAPRSIAEKLARYWAERGTDVLEEEERVYYPMEDDIQIARVAQFYALAHGKPVAAKKEYLSFLKEELYLQASEMATDDDDKAEAAYIEALHHEIGYSFSDMASELDFPRHHLDPQDEDPIRILARLPIRTYVTTSYHNFIEKELQAVGKNPRSRLSYWNGKPDPILPEHEHDPDYTSSEREPMVYHLLGMAQYPESMVLGEDDYIEFLWKLASDTTSMHIGTAATELRTQPVSVIPETLSKALKNSSLLVLGYQLQDWDLKIVLQGLLREATNPIQQMMRTAIHVDISEHEMVKDKDRVKVYLRSYFERANFNVRFEESRHFLNALWREYKVLISG